MAITFQQPPEAFEMGMEAALRMVRRGWYEDVNYHTWRNATNLMIVCWLESLGYHPEAKVWPKNEDAEYFGHGFVWRGVRYQTLVAFHGDSYYLPAKDHFKANSASVFIPCGYTAYPEQNTLEMTLGKPFLSEQNPTWFYTKPSQTSPDGGFLMRRECVMDMQIIEELLPETTHPKLSAENVWCDTLTKFTQISARGAELLAQSKPKFCGVNFCFEFQTREAYEAITGKPAVVAQIKSLVDTGKYGCKVLLVDASPPGEAHQKTWGKIKGWYDARKQAAEEGDSQDIVLALAK